MIEAGDGGDGGDGDEDGDWAGEGVQIGAGGRTTTTKYGAGGQRRNSE